MNLSLPADREPGRIYFSAGTPWPNGHRIERCALSGSLQTEKLLVSIVLESAPYDEARATTTELAKSEWGDEKVWRNFGNATFEGIILSGEPNAPVSLAVLPGLKRQIDPLPVSHNRYLNDELTFSVYLLGQGNAADHQFAFTGSGSTGLSVDWSARLALASGSASDFNHRFALVTPVDSLRTIAFPTAWNDGEAKAALKACLREHQQFAIENVDGERVFVRRLLP